jgi:D-amino peptidase
MKIYIMTDLEGVAGVLDSKNWCFEEGRFYSQATELLTMEINSAIEGFLEGGATEILVADGHGGGAINQSILHKKAEYAKNWSSGREAFSLTDRKFDFIAWIGQHPMAGTIGGHLTHTGNMGVVEQSINGIPVGEFGSFAMLATELGVRSIFGTGCKAFCDEAESFIPGIETVAVKKGTQTTSGNHLPREVYREHNKSAIHLHPIEARRLIKEGAKRAIERAQKETFGLVELPQPPYVRVRVMRGDDKYPPRILRQGPADSLLNLLDASYTFHELNINPADPNLSKLLGKRIV